MATPYELAAIGSGFVPGSGLLDVVGLAPDPRGGFAPSVMENIKRKEYIDALLQMAGAAGDAAMVVPPVGMSIKGAVGSAKAARAAKGLKEAQLAKKAPAVITEPKTNYLATTASKPNPLVGTRFQNELIPNTQAPRVQANLDEMLGGSLLTFPTDMLSRNVQVKNISGIDLNNPFVTEGGLPYMSDLQNIKRQIAYASNQGAATSQNNRALKAIEENLKRGGTGRVFVAPHTMPWGAENFSTAPTQGLLSLIDTVGINPELAGALSDRIRSATVKGVKGKYKDFVGIGDSGLKDQLMTGAGLTTGSAGDLRKLFVDKLSSVTAEKGLGFNYPDLQNAILDTNVMNKPAFWMGDSIYEALPHLGTSMSSHGAYSRNMPGVFFGNTGGAPISDVMGSEYQKARLANMNKPGPRPGTFADADQLARGALSTGGENVSLFIDKKELARLKRLLGQN